MTTAHEMNSEWRSRKKVDLVTVDEHFEVLRNEEDRWKKRNRAVTYIHLLTYVHDDLRPSTTNFFISVFLFKILPYSLLDFGPAVGSATYNYPWESTGWDKYTLKILILCPWAFNFGPWILVSVPVSDSWEVNKYFLLA